MEINYTEIHQIIGKHFSTEDIVYGSGSNQSFLVQYKGNMINENTEEGFSLLENDLEKFKIQPILRKFGKKQKLILIKELPKREKRSASLNLIFFILTLFSVLFTGGNYGMDSPLPEDTWQAIITIIQNGWPFAVSLLAILGAHEFGHYFAGKKHKVDVTLPFFIPFPFNTFGTMGAFINMRSIPKNKKQLFDIAITGPLSGLIVSIIVLIIGLNLSTLDILPSTPPSDFAIQMEGNSILYVLLKYITFGRVLPEPVGKNGIMLLIHWFQYFFTGNPFPWGGLDVMLHPVAWAGWAGMFVTMLNLIPAGQLDGGHILQAVLGTKNAQKVRSFIIFVLVLLGFFWNTWWLWAGLIMFFGRAFAEPLDQVTELDKKRKLLGIFMILVFLFTFIPVPIMLIFS